MSVLTKPYMVARKNNGVLWEPPASCVLWLPEQDDAYSATIKDRSGYGTNGTLVGASWARRNGFWYIDHDGTDDYVEVTCPQCNFTSSAFSGVIWAKFDAIGGYSYLIVRGLASNDGWWFGVENGGYLEFNTGQLGINQQTYGTAGLITTGEWFCLGFSRSGAGAIVVKNGVDISQGKGTHINPASSARTLKIGIEDDLTDDLDGQTALGRILSTYLSVEDHLGIYRQERHLLGV